MRPPLQTLVLPEAPEAWGGLGFLLEDGRCRAGATTLAFGDAVAWHVPGLEAVDGLPDAPAAPEAAEAVHPNGVVAVDHVVVRSPDLPRTVAAFEAQGLPCRRVREAGELRQAFFVLDGCLVEVVAPAEPDGDGPAAFWGVTLVCAELDGAAALLGDKLGHVKDAVQAGRRIATVRPEASGVRTPVAFITPR